MNNECYATAEPSDIEKYRTAQVLGQRQKVGMEVMRVRGGLGQVQMMKVYQKKG
jgi:hypothetical protein